MLIQSLRQHFPARAPEWFMAGMMGSWGFYVLLHPGLFTRPETRPLFQGLADMVWVEGWDAAGVWGGIALAVGLLRAAALFINGAYTRTPLIRLVCSFVSAFIWAQVVLGLIRSQLPNTGLAIYTWLVLIDVASAYRASFDIVLAQDHRARSERARHAIAGGH